MSFFLIIIWNLGEFDEMPDFTGFEKCEMVKIGDF